jgi:hypothetical protein
MGGTSDPPRLPDSRLPTPDSRLPTPDSPTPSLWRADGRRRRAAGQNGEHEAQLRPPERADRLLLVIPVALVLLGLVAYPLVYAVYISFTDRLVGVAGEWVGLANFATSSGNRPSPARSPTRSS